MDKRLKKDIKIKFVDFWPHWNKENNFIVNILKRKYNIIFSDNPDYIFFSNFNDCHEHMNYNNCVKIFYTQENICPDFNFCDYGIGFEYMNYEDRYIRYPIYLIEERYKSSWNKMKEKNNIKPDMINAFLKRDFCSFVVSNNKANKIRKEMFDKLTKYKLVNSGGRYLNNIGISNGVLDKVEFESKHKFSICFENSSHNGYSTEKLIEAFAAQTVPIYWGDPKINKIFNKNAFINVNSNSSVDEVIDKIKEIDNNEKKYINMLLAPALNDEYEFYWDNKQSELEEFLYNIFEQQYDKAFRRNREFWGEIYYKRYLEMRNLYIIFYQNNIVISIKKCINYCKMISKIIKSKIKLV